MYQVRLLVGADAVEYRALRLEALEHRSDLFSASYAEDQGLPVTRHQGVMAENWMFGGFRNETLEGVLALGRPTFVKGRHKAVIHGLYIRGAHWPSDLPDLLMNTMLRSLDREVEDVHARVSADDDDALLLFRRHGFSTVGTEPHALKLDNGRYVDHYLMHRAVGR